MAFDANALLNAVTTAATSTEYSLLPQGEEFTGLIKEVKLETGSKDGRDWAKANIMVEASGQKVRDALNNGRDKVTIRYGLFLDISESGGLASGPGSNVPLGRLRDAVGQNKAGDPWKFQDLVGQNIIFTVRHRKVDEEVFQDIAKILPLS
jgi:hypothetical protein